MTLLGQVPANPRVVITVSGGVADIAEQPAGVDVYIVDYDNVRDVEKLSDLDEFTQEWVKTHPY